MTTKTFFRISFVGCLVFFLLTLSGCINRQKLSGKVIFSDGDPLTTGTIVFSSGTVLARSQIKADGSFNVGSFKETDGIQPGKYKVYITDAVDVVFDPKKPHEEKLISLVDARYTSREKTPLEIEIPGEKIFNIIVERSKYSAEKHAAGQK